METEDIKQQIEELQLNTSLLTKDVSLILPSIITIIDSIDQTLKAEKEMKTVDGEDRKLLISCVKDVNATVEKYVSDYGNLQQQVKNIIDANREKEHWIEKKVEELKKYVSEIPAKTEVKHLHGIDARSTKWLFTLVALFICTLVLFSVSASMYINQQYLKDDSLKLRMARLAQPNLILEIDSIYHADASSAEYLVKKREEENSLLQQVSKKRKEIKALEK